MPDDTPPPDLSDAILLSIFRRIDWRDGGAGRIPIASVRASLTALSPAAFRVGLLDSERRGAIVLRTAEGDDVQPEGRSSDRSTTMIYTHVLNRGGLAVRSPLDGPFGPRP